MEEYYCLLEVSYDRCLIVEKRSDIETIGDKLYVPYENGLFPCRIIATDKSEELLELMREDLLLRVSLVNIVKFPVTERDMYNYLRKYEVTITEALLEQLLCDHSTFCEDDISENPFPFDETPETLRTNVLSQKGSNLSLISKLYKSSESEDTLNSNISDAMPHDLSSSINIEKQFTDTQPNTSVESNGISHDLDFDMTDYVDHTTHESGIGNPEENETDVLNLETNISRNKVALELSNSSDYRPPVAPRNITQPKPVAAPRFSKISKTKDDDAYAGDAILDELDSTNYEISSIIETTNNCSMEEEYSDPAVNASNDENASKPLITAKKTKKKTKSLMSNLQQITNINRKPLGTVLMNADEMVVPLDTKKTYKCNFCSKTLTGKFWEHVSSVHKREPRVIEIEELRVGYRGKKGTVLEPDQKLRLQKIAVLRKEAGFTNNCNTDEIINYQTERRPMKRVDKKTGEILQLEKTVSDYRVCPFCHGWYAKASIRKHIPRCCKYEGAADYRSLHNYIVGDLHHSANIYLRVVCCRFRNDIISQTAKRDRLITLYGNYEAFKYRSSNHHNKQIRAEMRLLSRILLAMRQKHQDITDLASIVDPKYVKSYIEVANELGRFNEVTRQFEAPATARDVGRVMAAACDVWITECIEEKLPKVIRDNAEDFLKVHKTKFSKLISKTVAESQTAHDLAKGNVKLPDKKDIKIVRNHVTEILEDCCAALEKKFCFNNWLLLTQATSVAILIFNRKRPGEVSRLLKILFETTLQGINPDTYPELWAKLSPKAKLVASKYKRFRTRGKKNNKVSPLLIDPLMEKAINLILDNRENAGVPKENPYIFGLPSRHTSEFDYCEAGPLLAKFAKDSGANLPELLRGTLLRKHIATVGLSLNLTNGEVESLAKFMGHDTEIHFNIYRQPVGTNDILDVSKWLEYAQGDYLETPAGPILMEDDHIEDMEEDEGEDEDDSYLYDNSSAGTNHQVRQSRKRKTQSADSETESDINDQDSTHKKKRKVDGSNNCKKVNNGTNVSSKKTALKTRSVRTYWPDECVKLMKEKFGERSVHGITITSEEIENFLADDNHKGKFTGRNVGDVRSCLQYRVKLWKDDYKNTVPGGKMAKKRNTCPKSIIRQFDKHIANGTVPTLNEYCEACEKSPSLEKLSYSDVKTWVAKAIEFDSSLEMDS